MVVVPRDSLADDGPAAILNYVTVELFVPDAAYRAVFAGDDDLSN